MNLRNRKRIVADMYGIGMKRVWIDPDRMSDVKEAITKLDIRNLVRDDVIKIKNKEGISRGRARNHMAQKRKGRRQGPGSRKGKRTARLPRKRKWINTVRSQRNLLLILKQNGLLSEGVYRDVRLKIKGGFFRSRRHVKLYLEEKGFIKHGNK